MKSTKKGKINLDPFSFTSFGISGAVPIHGRNHSCHIIKHKKKVFLIDCGEGAQLSLLKAKIKVHQIDHIFISHLHGDHFFGLIGLLSTLHLQGRTKKLTIHGPKDLEDIINIMLKASSTILRYPLSFNYLNITAKEKIVDSSDLNIYAFPLSHGIECYGFVFEEKPKPRKIIKIKLPKNASLDQISQILDGKDLIDENGNVLLNNDLTYSIPSRTFAYCSDTQYIPNLRDQLGPINYVFHEATFIESQQSLADKTHHSTTKDAAQTANDLQANLLIIGHFSGRYKDLNIFLNECTAYFSNTIIANEGMEITLEECQ